MVKFLAYATAFPWGHFNLTQCKCLEIQTCAHAIRIPLKALRSYRVLYPLKLKSSNEIIINNFGI